MFSRIKTTIHNFLFAHNQIVKESISSQMTGTHKEMIDEKMGIKNLVTNPQGWEFSHSLIAHSLRLLKSNERPWTIRSGRSWKMSNSLQKIWLQSYLLVPFTFIFVFYDKKTSDSLIPPFLMSDVIESLR